MHFKYIGAELPSVQPVHVSWSLKHVDFMQLECEVIKADVPSSCPSKDVPMHSDLIRHAVLLLHLG